MNEQFLNKLTEIFDANLKNKHFWVSKLARVLGMSRSNIHRKRFAGHKFLQTNKSKWPVRFSVFVINIS